MLLHVDMNNKYYSILIQFMRTNTDVTIGSLKEMMDTSHFCKKEDQSVLCGYGNTPMQSCFESGLVG